MLFDILKSIAIGIVFMALVGVVIITCVIYHTVTLPVLAIIWLLLCSFFIGDMIRD